MIGNIVVERGTCDRYLTIIKNGAAIFCSRIFCEAAIGDGNTCSTVSYRNDAAFLAFIPFIGTGQSFVFGVLVDYDLGFRSGLVRPFSSPGHTGAAHDQHTGHSQAAESVHQVALFEHRLVPVDQIADGSLGKLHATILHPWFYYSHVRMGRWRKSLLYWLSVLKDAMAKKSTFPPYRFGSLNIAFFSKKPGTYFMCRAFVPCARRGEGREKPSRCRSGRGHARFLPVSPFPDRSRPMLLTGQADIVLCQGKT
ncbi:hypothetical protein [Desulfovibrio sp.]|uniref:hypothetical protein n=1 Tax=Desulfovibrio sp. TaxID=885 RepID=UPI00307CFCC6